MPENTRTLTIDFQPLIDATSTPIASLLTNKTAKERARIKGQEIAKLASIPRTPRPRYDIEILSSLPDTAVISSATQSYYYNSKQTGDNDAQAYANIITTNPASNTDLVTADFDQVKGTDGNVSLGAAVAIQTQATNITFDNITINQSAFTELS